jgi:hypothetical protein
VRGERSPDDDEQESQAFWLEAEEAAAVETNDQHLERTRIESENDAWMSAIG